MRSFPVSTSIRAALRPRFADLEIIDGDWRARCRRRSRPHLVACVARQARLTGSGDGSIEAV